ncbi:MAG TPA: universal stress protein [Thermoanaerobacterales bacterium]|nr:universal stress protein [Thermoanaerobacterales bacterium]
MVTHYNPQVNYRIMVCITPQSGCKRLISKAAQRAKDVEGEFCAVYVNKSDFISKDLKQHSILQELFEYAQALGGRVGILVGKKVHSVLSDFARENEVNEIIVGKTQRTAFEENIIKSLKQQVEKSDINVEII